MPYIQPLTGNVFGLMPVEGVRGMVQTAPYSVSSSEAVAILPGDGIVLTTAGTVRAVLTADTPARAFIGAAAQALTTDLFAAGTLNLLVYDAPDQIFVIGESSGVITSTMLGQTFAVNTSSTAAGIPSTLVGRSKHCLNSVGSSGQMLRLIGIHPIETMTSGLSTASIGRKWLVVPSPFGQLQGNITS